MNPIDKIALMFRSPTAFYKKVHKEGLMEPFLFFLILYAAYQFVFTLLSIALSPETQTSGIMMVAASAVIGYVLGLVIAATGPWISAGLAHIGALIFQGKGAYTDTFKVTTYSSLINFAYLIPIELLNILLMRDPANMASLMTGVFITIPIALAGMVHVVYAQIQGFKFYHKMTPGKAFVSVFVIPVGIGLLIAGLFMLLFAAMMIPLFATMG